MCGGRAQSMGGPRQIVPIEPLRCQAREREVLEMPDHIDSLAAIHFQPSCTIWFELEPGASSVSYWNSPLDSHPMFVPHDNTPVVRLQEVKGVHVADSLGRCGDGDKP